MTQAIAQPHALPRTFIRDLPAALGEMVRLRGMILSRRDLGGLQFMVLRDWSGTVQCVGEGLSLELPLPESSVELLGRVRAHPHNAGAVEVQLQTMQVLAPAAEPTPVELPKLERAHPDTLLTRCLSGVRSPCVALKSGLFYVYKPNCWQASARP